MPSYARPIADVARQIKATADAVAFCREHDFLDLHLDGFICTRLFEPLGYDLSKSNRKPGQKGLLNGKFFGHLDFPRCHDAGLSGALWNITTNPARPAFSRRRALQDNIARLYGMCAKDESVEWVMTASEYDEATAAGKHAVLVVLQGGNALSEADGFCDVPVRIDGTHLDNAPIGKLIVGVTMVHLTHSFLGRSSTPIPFGPKGGLTRAGEALVESLGEHRVFNDLAHLHPDTFWRTVEVHRSLFPDVPLIDTHTGVSGVHSHWRNIDDAQVRAIAESGGVVGVVFERSFLTNGPAADEAPIVAHIEHLIDVGGEDCVALGSDYDGAIDPPDSLRNGVAYPRLVDALWARGHTNARIAKILGSNFLRTFRTIRP